MRRLVFRGRTGFTIVELLITIAIISGVTALALPTIKESLRSNTVSRAANLVTGAMFNARRLAVGDGGSGAKPHGIRIVRRRIDLGVERDGQRRALGNLRTIGANVGSEIQYVQAAGRDGTQSMIAYPVEVPAARVQALGLDTQATGCDRRYAYFVPRAESEILFAAAQQLSAASTLISIGSIFEVDFEGGSPQESIAAMVPMIANNQLTNYLNPGSCDLEFNGPVPIGQGTVLFTDHRAVNPLDHPVAGGRDRNIPGPTVIRGTTRPQLGQPVQARIFLNPVPAPLAPIALPGRMVIDLGVSGSRNEPLAFGVESIVDTAGILPGVLEPNLERVLDVSDDPADNVPPNTLNAVTVMFATDGRVDAVYFDVMGTDGRFRTLRRSPPPSLSFLIGFEDGVLDNVDDAARFPDQLRNAGGVSQMTFPPSVDNGGEAIPYAGGPPAEDWIPTTVPNYANSECVWATVNCSNGSFRTDQVLDPIEASRLNALGFIRTNQTPPNVPARALTEARIRYSRELVFNGRR